jgi:hypothetical protein
MLPQQQHLTCTAVQPVIHNLLPLTNSLTYYNYSTGEVGTATL